MQLGLRRRKKRQKIVSNSLLYFTPRRETYVDSIDIDVGDDPVFPFHVFSVDGKRQVLGHNSVLLNDFHARRLEILCEQAQRVVVVEFGTVQEPTSPCEDGGDRVRARLIALLVLAVVPGNGACNEKDLAPATCSVYVINAPCAASLSMTSPSGVNSSLVIIPRLPKPCARMSLCTSPS